MTIYKEFTFDAAHKLTRVPAGHKCARMHGHTYRLIVSIEGEPDESGMIIDYADLAAAVEPILAQVDHHTLNDLHGLENPTTEVVAPWLWRRIHAALPKHVMTVELKESSSTGCVYDGNDRKRKPCR